MSDSNIYVHLEKCPTSQSSSTDYMGATGELLETPLNKQHSSTASWQEVPVASKQLQHLLMGRFRGSTGNRQPKIL